MHIVHYKQKFNFEMNKLVIINIIRIKCQSMLLYFYLYEVLHNFNLYRLLFSSIQHFIIIGIVQLSKGI